MYISSELKRKVIFFNRPFVVGEIVEKSVAIIILVSLFFSWIYFPLTIDKSSFQAGPRLYFSFGAVLFILLTLFLLGLRFTLPLIIITVFAFPFVLSGNYLFMEKIVDELNQIVGIINFSKTHSYEPNIVHLEKYLPVTFFDLPLESIGPKIKLVIYSLGIGYLVSFLCSLFLLTRLNLKQLLLTVIILFVILVPTAVEEYYIDKGKGTILNGEYGKSIYYLNKAKESNKILRNGNLSETGFFNLMVGENLYRDGQRETPQSNFFIANKYEQTGSFQKAVDKYRMSEELAPAKDYTARALIKKSIADMDNKRFGSSLTALNNAYLINPDRIETIFYLQYLNSAIKDNERSISYGKLLIEKSGNKLLLSDVYNLLAKTYSELNQNQVSKEMYRKSLKNYDNLRKSNYPAWKGLAGW